MLVGCFWLFLSSLGVLSSPPFPTTPPLLGHPQRSSESLPGSRERQAKNVPSGLGAGNPEGSPEALASEETYLHCQQAPGDRPEPLVSEGRTAWGPHCDLTSTLTSTWGWLLCQCPSDSIYPALDRIGSKVVESQGQNYQKLSARQASKFCLML